MAMRLKVLLGLLAALVAGPVLAQSTATPVVPGYLTTSGCPAGYTSCFRQFGASAATSATHIQSAALEANHVISATPKALVSFAVNADATLSAATWYVMIYDATSAPVDGAVTPAKCFQVPSGTTQMGGTYASGGVAFTTGIVIGVSTTGCFTKTASSHAFIAGDFQ